MLTNILNSANKKLVFVLPEYDENSSTHFSHTLDLIDETGKYVDILLFIEYGKSSPVLKNVKKTYCQRFTFPVFSFTERFLCFLWFRICGFKNFYVHYSYWSGIIGGLVYRLTGGRFYYWHCEAYSSYGGDKKWLDLRWKIFDDLPLKFCLIFCSFLVTGTKSMADFYSKVFHVPLGKIKILPNSINLACFNAGDVKKKKNQVLFVHWLAPRKGADLLPLIISQCLRKNANLFFVIIGDGPLFGSLKNELGENPHVEMTGVLSNQGVKKYIAESELLIMPSRQEGFPRVILEAMALGTAFVSTDVGGVRDIVPYSCHLVDPNDIDGFAKNILRIISDSNLRDNLIKSCSQKVKEFSHVEVAKIFVSLI